MKRTHHCNEITKAHDGQSLRLIGWIDSLRDHGGLLFIDLRDREGITQIVVDPQHEGFEHVGHTLKEESVVEVFGTVSLRPEETINPRLHTGEVEVFAKQMEIHNLCKTLPFPLEEGKAEKVNEDLRLKHRYLDLRRPRNTELLRLRSRTSKAVRDYLDEKAFVEVETPILFKSTPEGAREFLVPSRLNPGEFYALTQSPQQYKQMLMVAGVERYFALAKCFRDEDLRADRQPEFTQIDLEMSFIDREDMYELIEGMLARVWKEIHGVEIETPFKRMPYEEAMNRYGVDKPDTRFDLQLKDFSSTFRESEFKVFSGAIQSGGCVKAFNAKGLADITQGELQHLEEFAKTLGAKGLAYIKVEAAQWKSPILKFLSEQEKAVLNDELAMEEGDLVFFAASAWEQACTILGRIRLEAASLLQKRQRLEWSPDPYHFLWVVDFPLMWYDEEVGQYAAAHHPFTAPVHEDVSMLDSEPRKVRGQHYDIVLNGVELGGGSIRIHQPDVQLKVFRDVLGIPEETVQERFGYMLEAFEYGAPPHGGIALGFDRLCAILGEATSIRDVIAFPKTQRGQDLMASAPDVATQKQLRDLHIKLNKTE